MFENVLIANRGEIALRILRACRTLGLKTIAVHSDVDAQLRHVALADQSLCIGPANATKSYLNPDSIIRAAKLTQAQAIHPGYGFLSENADFAQAVYDAGLIFIGPDADTIRQMGDKISAKRAMLDAGVPCVPGSEDALPDDPATINKIARKVGYPLIIKATAGGGGRGMRIVHSEAELLSAVALTQEEALRTFGNPAVYLERFLERPRHIEIQVLADAHGNAVWLGERDCSMQYRHQKVIEESPAPGIARERIAELGAQCVHACKQLGYKGAGTFEFLYQDGEFFFIEMNTRVQVEHPITELVTDTDIVMEQICIARGAPLSFAQRDIVFRGHSIECRINAEHPRSLIPSPGRVNAWLPAGGPGVRVESHLYGGYVVPANYDSMIAKVITHGNSREQALARMRVALDETIIDGINTTIALQRQLMDEPGFVEGGPSIHHLQRWLEQSMLRERRA